MHWKQKWSTVLLPFVYIWDSWLAQATSHTASTQWHRSLPITPTERAECQSRMSGRRFLKMPSPWADPLPYEVMAEASQVITMLNNLLSKTKQHAVWIQDHVVILKIPKHFPLNFIYTVLWVNWGVCHQLFLNNWLLSYQCLLHC